MTPRLVGEVSVSPRPVSPRPPAGRAAADPDPGAVARLLARRRGTSSAGPGGDGERVTRLLARRRRIEGQE